MRRAAAWVMLVVLFIGGSVALYHGLSTNGKPQSMPLPAVHDATAPVGGPIVGPLDPPRVEVASEDHAIEEASDGTLVVTPPAIGIVSIPGVGINALVDQTDQSEFKWDERSIKVPDGNRAVWWSKGAGIVSPSAEGTTFIAGHVSTEYGNGVFRDLSFTKPGMLVWTADANGTLKKWQVIRVHHEPRRHFSEDYWSSTGTRRLVIVTCGGTVDQHGFYSDNVFVEAAPVE